MDEEDQKDIIKKVKMSGAGDENDDLDKDLGDEESTEDTEDGFGDEEMSDEAEVSFGEEGLDETENILNGDAEFESQKNKILTIANDLREKGMEVNANNIVIQSLLYPGGTITDENLVNSVLDMFNINENNDILLKNVKNMRDDADKILSLNKKDLSKKLKGHEWANDHISTSADDAEEVADFLTTEDNELGECWSTHERVPGTKKGEKGSCRKKTSKSLNEAEYKGDKVTLNKPTSCKKGEKGCKKKFKVYVKNDKGNVVKVQFGDPNMEIRRDNAEAKKSFRARHKCSEKKDKTTAGYWSCKMWSNKKVSDIVENLDNSEKSPIFVETLSMKDIITTKLHETTKPAIKPAEPQVEPKRRIRREERIWEGKPNLKPKPKPKMGEGFDDTSDYSKDI